MRAKRGEKRAERWEGIEKGERKWEDKRPREREVRKTDRGKRGKREAR